MKEEKKVCFFLKKAILIVLFNVLFSENNLILLWRAVWVVVIISASWSDEQHDGNWAVHYSTERDWVALSWGTREKGFGCLLKCKMYTFRVAWLKGVPEMASLLLQMPKNGMQVFWEISEFSLFHNLLVKICSNCKNVGWSGINSWVKDNICFLP